MAWVVLLVVIKQQIVVCNHLPLKIGYGRLPAEVVALAAFQRNI
jgi:hypothetical protein